MRTGGIQGSRGPRVERRTEIVRGGEGKGAPSYGELASQHPADFSDIKIQSRTGQGTHTYVHTASLNPTAGLFLSWRHCTLLPSGE